MMNPETALQNKIMLALSDAGCTVWRNETGVFWAGKTIYKQGRQVTLDNARQVAAGLCKGSADIIGIAPDGAFLAIEVKSGKGKASKEQANFIQAVRNAGAVSGVARSVDEALEIVHYNATQS